MTDPTTQFIVDLFLLLGSAVLAGEVATHFKQPAMVGQLLVGILLGPTLLGPFIGLNPTSSSAPALSPQLGTMQVLATVFILFMAGLEVSPEDIFTMELSTVILGLSVLFIPFGLAATVLPSLRAPPNIVPGGPSHRGHPLHHGAPGHGPHAPRVRP